MSMNWSSFPKVMQFVAEKTLRRHEGTALAYLSEDLSKF
jgi:hypothetical protein